MKADGVAPDARLWSCTRRKLMELHPVQADEVACRCSAGCNRKKLHPSLRWGSASLLPLAALRLGGEDSRIDLGCKLKVFLLGVMIA